MSSIKLSPVYSTIIEYTKVMPNTMMRMIIHLSYYKYKDISTPDTSAAYLMLYLI